MCYIGTQPDKLKTAVSAFDELLVDLPKSEDQFIAVKENLISEIRTNRVVRESIFSFYLNTKKFGWKENQDPNELIFNKIQSLEFDNIKSFQQQYIKPLNYNYGLIGNSKDIDMKYIKTIGEVKVLSVSQVLGY